MSDVNGMEGEVVWTGVESVILGYASLDASNHIGSYRQKGSEIDTSSSSTSISLNRAEIFLYRDDVDLKVFDVREAMLSHRLITSARSSGYEASIE
jgi:hypothetical protein